jgi:hypothetical protein
VDQLVAGARPDPRNLRPVRPIARVTKTPLPRPMGLTLLWDRHSVRGRSGPRNVSVRPQ